MDMCEVRSILRADDDRVLPMQRALGPCFHLDERHRSEAMPASEDRSHVGRYAVRRLLAVPTGTAADEQVGRRPVMPLVRWAGDSRNKSHTWDGESDRVLCGERLSGRRRIVQDEGTEPSCARCRTWATLPPRQRQATSRPAKRMRLDKGGW